MHELEMQISNTKVEVDQVKSKLASAHEHIHRLEQRNKELETIASGVEKSGKVPPHNEVLPADSMQQEKTSNSERHWYSRFIFWE